MSGEEPKLSGSKSQLGQDLWVLEKTGQKRNGYFVEIGAMDGAWLSNTYLLEKEYGWSGICVEANPKYLPALKENRSCEVVEACVGPMTGKQVQFVLADQLGGIEDYSQKDLHAHKRTAKKAEQGTLTLTTISMVDLLDKIDAPESIDYLSIDTEGSELDILKAFDFDRWRIECITVEHNFTDDRENLFRLLSGHGYTRQECKWDDFYSLV